MNTLVVWRRQRLAGVSWWSHRVVAMLLAARIIGAAAPVHAQTVSVAGDTAARTALLTALRRGSPELAARSEALRSAQARFHAVGYSAPLGVSGELEEVPRFGDVGQAGSARLSLTRNFPPTGLRGALRSLAQTEVDQARVAFDVAERSLIVRAELLLTRAASAVRIARRIAAEDSLISGAEESIRIRFVVGSARYVDVLRLRTERLRIQTERAAALAEANVSRRALAGLVSSGDADSAATRLVDSVFASLIDARRGAPSAMELAPLAAAPRIDPLLRESGAVRLADIEVRRAEAERSIALAEQRPQLSASLGAQRFQRSDGVRTLGPTLAFSLSLPFTARAGTAASVAAANQQVVAAQARLRAATATTRIELTAARDRYDAARERLALYDAALLRGAREERESALAAYRSGALSLLELLDFERALARAEIAQLAGRVEAADALADLLGGASGGIEVGAMPNDHTTLRTEGAR